MSAPKKILTSENLNKLELYAIGAGVIVALYLVYKGGNKLVDIGNKTGEAISNIGLSDPQVALSGNKVTLGEVVVTSNPFNFIPNVITAMSGNVPSGMTSLNVSVTDTSFAKIGMTTAGVVQLENSIGYTAYANLQMRLMANTLTANDKSLLYSTGWNGTCTWW